MKLADFQKEIRIDLADLAEDAIKDGALTRALERALSDLSRFLPLSKILEQTIVQTVTHEAWTSAATAGTYVALANKPIKVDSDVVKNAAGTTCTRNTDFTIDYSNSKITHISGGDIGNGEACTISYTKSLTAVDVSSIAAELIRIDKVEYPLGNVPQTFVSYETWGDLLTVIGEETQSTLTNKKHIGIYYKAKHTMPTSDTAGSHPSFLDNTLVLAAAAYVLFMLAVKYDIAAATSIVAANTSVTSISHTEVTTALANIKKYVDNNEGDDAATILAMITDEAAVLRTAINTAVDAANTYLDAVVATDITNAAAVWADEVKHILTEEGIPNAEDFLETGDDLLDVAQYLTGDTDPSASKYLSDGDEKINVVTEGARVGLLYTAFSEASRALAATKLESADGYRRYAEAALTIAQLWDAKRKDLLSAATIRATAAVGYCQEAAQRLDNIRTYIEEAAGWMNIAGVFRSELEVRMSEMDRYLSESSVNLTAASQYMQIAEKFRLDAIERRNEVWGIWRSPEQYVPESAQVAVRQTS